MDLHKTFAFAEIDLNRYVGGQLRDRVGMLEVTIWLLGGFMVHDYLNLSRSEYHVRCHQPTHFQQSCHFRGCAVVDGCGCTATPNIG